MAVFRQSPKCPKCGCLIKSKHWQPETFFCGDTFIGWDWKGHICRLGEKFFIERSDNNQWWADGKWTIDPMEAMIFIQREAAEEYLKNSLTIPPRIECVITEHIFIDSLLKP